MKRAIATVVSAGILACAGPTTLDRSSRASIPPRAKTTSDTTAVITAAGDICSPKPRSCTNTAMQVLKANPAVALALGDNQYQTGTLQEYLASYDLQWGQFKALTKPTPGNHEWKSGRSGYDSYFGTEFLAPDGAWYSYDVGDWHLVSLDSNCTLQGGCGPGSPMYDFLSNDLAIDQHLCTLAYWHHPAFSSGTKHGGTTSVQPLWELLYADGAEIVLNGHEHNYERFAPQTPTGEPDPATGITQIVIGTGGMGADYPFGTPVPNSLVRKNGVKGIGTFTLTSTGWEMQFVSQLGVVKDTASGTCH
jgi:calcineurin-like phosphoesterase family protein